MENKFAKGYLAGIVTAVALVSLVIIGYSIITFKLSGQEGKGSIIRSEESKTSKEATSNSYNIATDDKVQLIQNIIDQYYLNSVTEDAIAEGVYKGLMSSLDDPYSVYYTKDEYDSITASTQGTYCGIGAMVSQNVNTGIITIVKVYDGSPAQKGGLRAGDIIFKVEDEEVTGIDLTTVVTKMKGEAGTKVNVTVARDGERDYVETTLTRAEIEVPTIEYEMLDGKIGYIIISEFDEVTAEQFRNALKDLEKQGQKGLIIDLRDNGGGVLSAVVDMLDRMIEEGMLVYTETKAGVDEEFKAEDKDAFDKPLAVLVNANSASASEVFSGAIQDYGLGKLIGTTTFGKGIVQSIVPLGDGSAIKLTTAKYYTPKGRNIHETGLTPDIQVEIPEDAYEDAVIERDEDTQLKKAIEEIKKEIK